MDTVDKGQIAVLKVELRAIEKGFIVSKPTREGSRYDLVLDDGARLLRVQVKWCNRETSGSNNAFDVRLEKYRRQGEKTKTKRYSADEVDALLVYLPTIDRICWFEPETFAGKQNLVIRTAATKNNQTSGCRMADDYFW